MENQRFTYEAVGQVLVVHMPRELDHHNCRNLKYETDLLLEENPIRRMVFDFSKTEKLIAEKRSESIKLLNQMIER